MMNEAEKDWFRGAVWSPEQLKQIEEGRKYMAQMEYNRVKEVDPNGKDQHDAGAKLDSGKPDCSLLGMFGRALRAVAMVGTHGANKYTRGGWQSVPNGFNRYTAAMLRHYFYENEEDYDQDLPDTLHAAQVAWNSLARLELKLREMEKANEDTTD